MNERETLVNYINALKTTGKQQKIEDTPLFLATCMPPQPLVDYENHSVEEGTSDHNSMVHVHGSH